MHFDFSKIVQETAKRNEREVFFGQMAKHAHHGREDGDIHAVCKGIGIVCTNICELDKILMVIEETEDN